MDWKYTGYKGVITLPDNAVYMASIPIGYVDWNDVTTTLKQASSYSRLLRCGNE
jgi:hypothetical protein